MLRKISNIIMVLLLLMTTGGYTISRHYCGSELVSVTVYNKAKSCCEDRNGNCCHDESEYFQLKEDFIAAVLNFNFDNVIPFEIKPVSNYISVCNKGICVEDKIQLLDNSPPPVRIHSVLEQLQNFLL